MTETQTTSQASSGTEADRRPASPAPRWMVTVIAAYLMAAAIVAFTLMAELVAEPSVDGVVEVSTIFGTWMLESDVRLLMLAAVSGALGSFIHAATSLADYIGNQRIVTSWLTWYVFRPLIGGALAVVLYFVMRAGLLSAANGPNVNLHGVAAVSALAGMFSKQATDKLDEVFRTMFRTEKVGDAHRADKLDRGAPRIVAVSPPSVPLHSGSQELTISGDHLTERSFVTVNDVERPTRFDKGRLVVTLLPGDTAHAGVLTVAVSNRDGGAKSAPVSVTVT